MTTPFYFDLSRAEALDVLTQIERLAPNKDGYASVYYTLLAQYIVQPWYLATEDNSEIECENGTDLLVLEYSIG